MNANRALYRVGCYAFKTRLEEKAQEARASVVYTQKFTPTSKTCSSCGATQDIALSDRIFVCQHCGLVIDRDVNAAINVYKYCC